MATKTALLIHKCPEALRKSNRKQDFKGKMLNIKVENPEIEDQKL